MVEQSSNFPIVTTISQKSQSCSARLKPDRDQSYRAENLAPGTRLSLAITNLPAAPHDYRWLARVALVLIIAAGYALHRRRNASAAETEQGAQVMIPQNT